MILLQKDTPLAPAATQVLEEVVVSEALGREVSVSVVLPPGFDQAGNVAYPVLYLNDGQDLPRLGLQATLDKLFAQNAVQPFVLIAPHADENRVQEYGVAAQADYNGRGSRAGAYTRFVLEELLPFAQLHHKVSAEADAAVFAGFSLGGLSAFDVVWHHPEYFARAGVFSGSFWWRSRAIGAGYTPADRIMQAQVRAARPHPSHRFWLQTGTLDERNDRNENGVIDSLEDCLDLIEELKNKGMNVAETIRYVQVEGGHHHPDTWGRVMPDFLRWAFGTAGGSAAQPAPLPVVRLQLDPDLTLAIVPAAAPPVADSAPPMLLPNAPAAATEPDSDSEDTFAPETPAIVLLTSTLENPMPVHVARPADGDYLPYYAGYINLVPENADPFQALRGQPQNVHEAFAKLTDEQAHTAYAPGKWTAKQILLHIIDCERIFAYRALRFARGDEQALAGFDENDYSANGGANARSMNSLLAEYDANRSATLSLFESFTDEQLNRRGTANNAAMTVRALLFILAGHERHHLNVFQERYLPIL